MTRDDAKRAGAMMHTATPQPLEPLRFALSGRSLIEASAGTGKTFTIAMLYVRLVLGHAGLRTDRHRAAIGDSNAYDDDHVGDVDDLEDRDLSAEQAQIGDTSSGLADSTHALTPPEILVVTFTEAATQELRDRIRARLTEAAAYFQADPATVGSLPPGQDLLHDLRNDYPHDRWLGCARKLQLAAEWMDEAAVSTIHGWCNRMLREHAFDSDSLFTQSLEADQTELLADVARDYWRSFMAPLDASDARAAAIWFDDPDALRARVRGLLEHADVLPEGLPPAEAIASAKLDAERALAELKAPWAVWTDEMEQLLDVAREAKQFKPRKLAKGKCAEWLNVLRSWASDVTQTTLTLSETAWTDLSASGLAALCVQGDPPVHDGFTALETLRARLAALPDGGNSVLCHAVKWIAQRFADEQGRRSQMGFGELLTRLDAALQGPNGERLASVIRTQFPVALIDEFQDTDPVQYRIFDTVYAQGAGAARPDGHGTALIMIGDPKQAIYAFRGADIHTYLAARRACGDQLYTLTRNFRSTHEMVEAANACFSIAEHRERGAGAFLFRRDDENPVPFVEVDAQGRADRFVVDGQRTAALTAWWLAPEQDKDKVTKGAFLEQMSATCASQMVRLLNEGHASRTGFEGPDGLRALRPADMAVLVNNRNEADAIRGALARRGVRSVYLSDKDSVFSSAPAAEIQHWLAACADPDDGRLVRTALATRTLGLAWTQLDRLRHDELAWEACVLRFRDYRECWRRQGVLPMLRRILNDYRVPARLLESAGGERTLTDVLHLSELLQQASTLIDGEHGLIRWLAEERQAAQADGASASDAQQIRLESDGDLVKVVTVHKSKGLEYPLVFLPFGSTFREVDRKDVPLKWHDDHDVLHVELSATDETLARADHERLAEDLRKLYVALTRARYATWIGVAALDALERSAFGYLLGAGEPIAPHALPALLESTWGTRAQIATLEAPAPDTTMLVERGVQVRTGFARRSEPVVREPWWIASYSSLKMAQDGHAIAADTPDEDVMMELFDAEPFDGALLDDALRSTLAPPEARRGANDADVEDTTASALAQTVPDGIAAHASVTFVDTDLDTGAGKGASASADAPTAAAIHAFPRGSDPGSFLHDLLEWMANQGFSSVVADPDALRDVVARRCNVRGWERWIDVLTQWVLQIASTPLGLPNDAVGGPTAVRLSELETYLAEMEFWVAAHAVDTQRLDALVCTHTLDGASRPALEASRLNGMLKGFMDLVFELDGRYYVADYKSNWLGPDNAAYTHERMRAQVLHSRYELQYVLYLFALHRLLKARLPDYDYDVHIGGAVYLFVRGIGAPTRGLHVERVPRELIDALDGLFAHRRDANLNDEAFA